jgi:tRNA pseudouridine13 synthase
MAMARPEKAFRRTSERSNSSARFPFYVKPGIYRRLLDGWQNPPDTIGMAVTSELAYLTGDLPGIGGQIKQRFDDFLVEEQPLYEPSGEGEHLYLFVEKTDQTTRELVRRAARAFRLGRGNVGHAGLKDKRARTRQFISVHLPGVEEQAVRDGLDRLNEERDVQVLWADKHKNKLRRGHHAGNRFVIYIRDVSPTAVVGAKPIMNRLIERGAANYLGQQRFGYRQNGHLLGRYLLLGEHETFLDELLGGGNEEDSERLQRARSAYEMRDYDIALAEWPKTLRHDRQALDALRRGQDAKRAVAAIDRDQRQFLVHALQSAVFNRVLDQRVREDAIGHLRVGDLAWKHENRSVFAVDQSVAETENGPGGRVGKFEISPSGPMWGIDMPRAGGQPGEAERQALEAAGLTEKDLAGRGHEAAAGSRRPLRVALKDPDISGGADEHGPFVRLAFELPRGAYATAVLREVMKDGDVS